MLSVSHPGPSAPTSELPWMATLQGNAFACRWKCNEQHVCWVTQLVVDRNYRERGLAVGLLTELKRDNDTIYGLVSSHVAACLAAAKAFGSTHPIRMHS